ANHPSAEAPHHHRAQLAVDRRTDEPADLEPAVLDEILAAEELVLMPVTRDERRRLRERGIQMLHAFDAHHPAREPPEPDDPEAEWHRHRIEHASPQRHAAAGPRDAPIERVSQPAARARFGHADSYIARKPRSFRDRRGLHKAATANAER